MSSREERERWGEGGKERGGDGGNWSEIDSDKLGYPDSPRREHPGIVGLFLDVYAG